MEIEGQGIRGWGLGMLVGLFMMGSAGFGGDTPAASGEPGPKIKVTIYNYAEAPSATLAEAEAAAARIFERAGIEISWQEHRATDLDTKTIANRLRTRNEVHITMHIIPRSMAARLAPSQICLGLSVVPGGNKRGDMAWVFYHRVEELARRRSLSAADSLGHAMAHEIGHLLLGVNSHSPTGLMRARWDQSDLLRAAKGWLIFTDAEAGHLRREVDVRLIDNTAATTGRVGFFPQQAAKMRAEVQAAAGTSEEVSRERLDADNR